MAKQLGFHVNLSACSGCKACQIACKDKNDLTDDRMWRRVITVEGGEWIQRGDAWLNNIFGYFLSSACMHCENPLCVEVCPTSAMWKREEDGIVLIDQDKCIGCRYCEWACPYGAPQFDATAGVMSKCNMCFDYVDAGQKPACVSACQMRVLEFGDVEELRVKYGALNDVYPLPDPSLTSPSIVYTPHEDTIRATTDSVELANREEL
ncbi:MAG: dimethylsulfoxide reductase subunit B [Anaerolineae bacterium]|nr:dimethylsulfoxide reductase subunit B [Chloroflexota bacterium]MBP6298054.1 dimethylsulfoxide reductase subunit B [Anaerolineae bacterium]